MASEVDFTDEEIREELANLGYHCVPQEKLEGFKKDLMRLISAERSKTNSFNSSNVTDGDTGDDNKQSNLDLIQGIDSDGDNLTNHGSQWIDKGFKEDWHYRGVHSESSRPQTAPSRAAKTARGKDVAFKGPISSAAFETNQSCCYDDSQSDSLDNSRYMKRKTSRKTADGHRMVDESLTSDADSETAGIYEIYEKIKKLAMRECECGKTRPKSGDCEPPYRIKGKVNKDPSVIKVNKEPPHTRNLVRTDRNARLKMYEKCWKSQPAVGEDHRFSLRKSVRARMLEHFSVQLPEKVYVPNLYVPPHEKDRVGVRWGIRKLLKNYEMPEPGFYHEV